MRALNTHRLVAAIAVIAVFAMAARVPLDADVWWHLAGGRLIVAQGAAPQADPWSWSVPLRTWIDNGWLWQVLIYGLYARFGTGGLVVLVALVTALAYAVVYTQMAGSPFLRAGVTVLAAAAAAPVWSARPQMATFLLVAIAAALIARYQARADARWLWPLPALAALWVNLHAGYVTLFLLIACAALGLALAGRPRAAGPLLAAGLAALLAALLNPYGARMWVYPFYNAGQAFARAHIAEWAAPDFHLANTQPFLLLLLALVAALALSRHKASAGELIALVAFGLLALQAQRAIGLFALVAAPVVARHLASREPDWLARPAARPAPAAAVLNGVLLGLVLLGAGLKLALPLAPAAEAEALAAMGVPAAAGGWLARERPAARLFNAYDWGGYLIWSGYPARQVFVDGRADLYGDAFLFEYAAIARADAGWDEALARYGVDTVLVPAASPLARELAVAPGWRLAFAEQAVAAPGTAVVYARD
jgi:hypothetical protein